ncbi:hypothetical protein SLE2022_125390 [Rubroshorea leprosula]
MTRKKVKLTWIVNDNARRASLRKRRLGLLKKVSELTTLCGINAFLILYSPDEVEPVVWPSRPVVQQLLARFHAMPEMERSKKMINQESFMRERLAKVQEQLKKYQNKNKLSEGTNLMHHIESGRDLDSFNLNELHVLVWYIEELNKDLGKQMEYWHQVLQPPQEGVPLQHFEREEMVRGGGDSLGLKGRDFNESAVWDQWFIDMMNSENRGQSSSNISDIGVPQDTYKGKSTVDDMVLPHHSFLGGSDMGLVPHGNFNPPSIEIQGLQPSNLMGFKVPYGGGSTEIGQQPLGNIGGNITNIAGNEFFRQPSRQLGESSSSNSSTENDNPFQFDFSKTWPSP